jgi:hypothetical protein
MNSIGCAHISFHSRPLKTGQLTSYVTGNYDLLGEGVSMSKNYAILTAGQYSGTTAITINGKTDNHSNNCVFDLRTRLMWSRYVAASVGPASDGKLPWTTNANGEGIFTYMLAARAANLAGFNNWFIPTDEILVGLRDMEAPTAAPDAVAFPSWPGTDRVWSTTTAPTATTTRAGLNYFSGFPGAITGTTTYFCILVRQG